MSGESPFPMEQRKPRRVDSEYIRKGTYSIFVYCQPLVGWGYARERLVKSDWAEEIRLLLNQVYLATKKVRLVSDNLNTHVISWLYQAFLAPATPLTGSLLPMMPESS
jgi:hypothetical protein